MARGIGLLGQKVGMTQVFDKDGRAVGATLVEDTPLTVTRVRSVEADGYAAVQVAWRETAQPERHLAKAQSGAFAKAGLSAHRRLTEFRAHPVKESPAELAMGAKLTVALFKPGDRVDIQGTSKGKGFQGVVKRHGFRGGPDTHGSMSHRAPGSVGSSTDPGHTLRGLRMAGRMGDASAISLNLEVLQVDEQRHLLVVKGAVPGAIGSVVRITPTLKKRAPSAARLWVEVHDQEGAKTALKKPAVKK